MSPLRYCLWSLGTALGAALVLALANHHLTQRRASDWFVLEGKMAAMINSGQAVILPSTFNEGALRWSSVESMPVAPEAVIFGSSHGLVATAEMIGSPRAMNLSISGASFFEHFVSSELLDQRGFPVSRRLLFVDPWLFDRGADSGSWRPRAPAFFAKQEKLRQQATPALEPLVTPQPPAQPTLWQRLSLENVTKEIDLHFNQWLLAVQPAPASALDATVLATDGSLRLAPERHDRPPQAAQAIAEQQFTHNPDRHRYGSYPDIDELVWQYFEQWTIRSQQTSEVVFVLSPYHPAIHARIVATPNNQTLAIERRVRAFAAARQIRVLGSYDPKLAGLEAAEFVDGDHLTPAGLSQLLKPLRDTAAAATTTRAN